jgi:hypothetical protein
MRKLFNILREITKDGSPFKFGYSIEGKGSGYFDNGLNEDMEYLLYTWMSDSLAPHSNYHSTDYELKFNENILLLKCTANWDDLPHTSLNSYYEIFDPKIIKIILPEIEYDKVILEDLPIKFECEIDETGYKFSWGSNSINYYDVATDKSYETSLSDLKQILEPLFYANIRDFGSGINLIQVGSWTKIIIIEPSQVRGTTIFFLNFDLDEF